MPGRGNEPYAQQTELGWGIVGNITNDEDDSDEIGDAVHRIANQSICAAQTHERACTFCVTTSAKEVINPQEIRRMMEWDFSESSEDHNPIS
jgi:hypothetical protein